MVMITVLKVMAKMETVNRELFIPSQGAGTRGLKLKYQALELKSKVFFSHNADLNLNLATKLHGYQQYK